MVVGTISVTLQVPASASLKDKRQVIRSLKDGLRRTYSISIAETGEQDTWQSAELLVAYAASDTRHAQEVLSKIVAFAEDYHLPLELVEAESELIHF